MVCQSGRRLAAADGPLASRIEEGRLRTAATSKRRIFAAAVRERPPGVRSLREVALDIDQRAFEVGQDLRAEPHHPGRTVLEAERAERDYELAEVVAGVKDFHCGAQRGL